MALSSRCRSFPATIFTSIFLTHALQTATTRKVSRVGSATRRSLRVVRGEMPHKWGGILCGTRRALVPSVYRARTFIMRRTHICGRTLFLQVDVAVVYLQLFKCVGRDAFRKRKAARGR
jgi:hypothetical protein